MRDFTEPSGVGCVAKHVLDGGCIVTVNGSAGNDQAQSREPDRQRGQCLQGKFDLLDRSQSRRQQQNKEIICQAEAFSAYNRKRLHPLGDDSDLL